MFVFIVYTDGAKIFRFFNKAKLVCWDQFFRDEKLTRIKSACANDAINIVISLLLSPSFVRSINLKKYIASPYLISHYIKLYTLRGC